MFIPLWQIPDDAVIIIWRSKGSDLWYVPQTMAVPRKTD